MTQPLPDFETRGAGWFSTIDGSGPYAISDAGQVSILNGGPAPAPLVPGPLPNPLYEERSSGWYRISDGSGPYSVNAEGVAVLMTSAAQEALPLAAVPIEGETIILPDTRRSLVIALRPAGPLASVDIQLPTDASTREGQLLLISCTQPIDALNLTGATVYNGVTVISTGDCIAFAKIDTNTWARIV